jgi:hypothetical protein
MGPLTRMVYEQRGLLLTWLMGCACRKHKRFLEQKWARQGTDFR